MRVLVKSLAALLVLGAVAAAVLYWGLGVRMHLDGSGMPRLVRVQPPEAADRRLQAHRATQREGLAPVSVTVSDEPSLVGERAETLPPAPGPDDRTLPEALSEPRALPPYWLGFRGPLRDGTYRERAILTRWPAQGLEPLWKQPIGAGYASFAIVDGRAFTIEQRRHQEVVTAYDVETGRELWAHGWDGEFKEWMGGDGPRATPTWFDGRVYTLGALGELRALDARTGALVWRVNMLDDAGAENLQWGMAASPLVLDEEVVVLPGGAAGRSVVAYDRLSGKRRWSALDDKAAYSSPMLVTIAGQPQILAVTAHRVVGLVPGSGELLWEFPWVTGNDIHASQPVVVGDRRVLLSSAYGRGAALIEIEEHGGQWMAKAIWEQLRLKNRFSSSVVYEGHIYGLDENILTCLDVDTGEVKWKAGRYGHGQFLLASGHLVLLSEDGDLALIRANPERHEELVRFPVLSGKTWNHPALDQGILLVRNLAEMAAFDLRLPN